MKGIFQKEKKKLFRICVDQTDCFVGNYLYLLSITALYFLFLYGKKKHAGQLLDAILPTALIKQAASLVGLPKDDDPTRTAASSSTSNTNGKGGNNNNDNNNDSMGRCKPDKNTGNTDLKDALAAILRLQYSMTSHDLGTTGSSTVNTASSSSTVPPMMQMPKQEGADLNNGVNPNIYQQQEAPMSASPKTYHRDVETFKETLDTATRSAESITNDIDDLQFDIESLAANIGLDPAQFNDTDFSGLNDQHFFNGGRSDILTGASRNDKIQLYQLAGGSHVSNKYDTSQSLKGKAVVSSVGIIPTPVPAAAAAAAAAAGGGGEGGGGMTGSTPLLGTVTATAVAGGLVGAGTTAVPPHPPMNLSTAPFVGGSQIPTIANTTTASAESSSLASSSPLPPQLPLGTGVGMGLAGGSELPGATTTHPSVAATAAASIAAQQLFNTGVSPLFTTLLQTLSPSLTSNLNNSYAHPSFDFYHHRGGRFGAPQQQGSPSFSAAAVPIGNDSNSNNDNNKNSSSSSSSNSISQVDDDGGWCSIIGIEYKPF